MGVGLLDVNALLALLMENNDFHPQMARWFTTNQHAGWATCPITELGFVRVISNAAFVKPAPKIGLAIDLLRRSTQSSSHHRFWPEGFRLSDLAPSVKSQLTGHKQITDAYLLSIAIRNGGRLVTFDRRIRQLAPQGSEEQDSLEILT